MALALLLVIGMPSLAGAKPPEKKWVKGQVLVHPNAGLSEDEFSQILNRHKGKKLRKIPSLNVHVIEVPEQAEEAVANALSHNPHVKFAEVNEIIEPSALIPNDPNYPNQWHLSKIQGPEAWSNALGAGVTVAVLDSGIDAAHQDFSGQLLTGWNVISGNSSNVSDITGHGTAVAGVVMAKGNNGVGVASVAWGGKILPVRVTNASDGLSTLEYMAAGITYAANQGAKVANLSYQVGAGNYSTINSAAQYMRNKGGVVVVAAGNTGGLREGNDNAYLISVSATTSSDAFWSSSSYGNFVDVAAPGSAITTTNRGGGYGAWSGTSFSSPMTAGVMALILSANPSLSPQAAENILEGAADDLGTQGWDNKFGHGRINAARAVEMAMVGTANDTQDPTVQFGSPSAGSTVSGIASIAVSASDNVGVTRVELYAGGVLVGQDTTAPYQFSWDTRNGNNGNVALQALAYDAANNVGTTTRTVTVNNAPDTNGPTVSIVAPGNGTKVKGMVTVDVMASSNKDLLGVVLYVGSARLEQDIEAPFQFSWDSTTVSDGNVTLIAHAYDTEFTKGSSEGLTLTVNNTPGNSLTASVAEDTIAPTVNIENPLNGSTVFGKVPIVVHASDENELSVIHLYVDDQLQVTSDRRPLTFEWQANKSGKGHHTIKAVAVDAMNNLAEIEIQVSVNNQKGKPKGP